MKKKLLALAIVLAIVAAMIVPMAVSASTFAVSATGSDTGTSGPFATIGYALSVVPAGSTINVAAGTYVTSSIGVTKGVTIDGPNVGVNPNTGSRSAEAIIQFTSGAQGFQPSTTSPVTIDGFTIEGPGMMLYTADATNVTFQNDIITDVATGEGFFYSNPATLGFINNKVTDATINGNNSDILFVAGNWNGSTGTVVTITGNVFDDSAVAVANQCDALNLSSCSGTISGNTFENLAYYGVLLANICGETVSNNIFNNIAQGDTNDSHGAGVRFYTPSGSGPVSITGNTFENSYIGLAVRDPDNPGAPASIASMNVTITNNNFGPNNHFNIYNGSSGAVDAAYNNWGSGATGTSIFASFGGTGAPLIVYQPFNNATTTTTTTTNTETVTVAGTDAAPTVAFSAPSPVTLNNGNGMMLAGWNVATGGAGSVALTQGTSNNATWTVTAAGASNMVNGSSTPLQNYLLLGTAATSQPWYIANGSPTSYNVPTALSAGGSTVTSTAGPLTYSGQTLSATLPFFAAQYVTPTDALGVYSDTITFTASCMP
jgi:hypothetical protein